MPISMSPGRNSNSFHFDESMWWLSKSPVFGGNSLLLLSLVVSLLVAGFIAPVVGSVVLVAGVFAFDSTIVCDRLMFSIAVAKRTAMIL